MYLYSDCSCMKIFKNKVATIISIFSFLLLSVISVNANAAALVWGTGIWGDTWQSQPTSSNDSDGDGVVNTKDAFPNDNVDWHDLDGDGIGDNSDIDVDGDGILNYVDPDDDNDGLSDVAEKTYGTDPYNPDTDGDGMSDGAEVAAGRNPLVNEPAALLILMSQ